jgi:hypothetical protein
MFKFITLISLFFFISTPSRAIETSGKLLLTGGVSQLEGSGGGGLTPWAFIGGYETRDQIGANAYYTNITLTDYKLESLGAMVGLFDRVELSAAREIFDTQDVGSALGLGRSFKIKQNIFGLKVKVIGDGVLDQDSWLPQIAIGAQYKINRQGAIVKSLKAVDDKDTDLYLSATKIFLSQSFLVNTTFRRTRANQLGILGFGGDKNNSYKLEFEGSVAYLLTRKLALGAEIRTKPDNLNVAKEENWGDVFFAWAATKNVSLTGAYALLGNIAPRDNQTGYYASLQVGF